MEISDDKVMDILMGIDRKTTLVVERLDAHCKDSAIKHKNHSERLTRLETEASLEPMEKNWKYWSKKLAPWTAGISLLGYVIFDIYTRIVGGK